MSLAKRLTRLSGRSTRIRTLGPQIQEEAVVELANILEEKMKPTGLALVMEADHFCMQWRGVKDLNSKMVNSVMRGSFLKDANLRREFLALMDKNQGK